MSERAGATNSADSAWPPPRKNPDLVGHEAAEESLWAAYHAQRIGHAWLITGQRGIGKATLAFRFSRYVLAHPVPAAEKGERRADLSMVPEHPLFRRVAGGATRTS